MIVLFPSPANEGSCPPSRVQYRESRLSLSVPVRTREYNGPEGIVWPGDGLGSTLSGDADNEWKLGPLPGGPHHLWEVPVVIADRGADADSAAGAMSKMFIQQARIC